VSEPKRFLDDPGELSPAERRALEAALGERPPSGAKRAVLGAVLGNLPPSVDAPTGLEALGAATTKATGSALAFGALAKSAALGVALGVATTVTWVSLRPSDPRPIAPAPPAQSAPGRAASPPASARSAAPERTPAPDERTETQALRGKASSSHEPDASSAPPVHPVPAHEPPAPSTGAFPDDATLAPTTLESRRLAEARALLRSGNAVAALAALAAIRSEFPRGALVQEREALVIEALLATGKRDEARERAREFLGRYPTSPHAAAARRAAE
jgi:hypothetical protein